HRSEGRQVARTGQSQQQLTMAEEPTDISCTLSLARDHGDMVVHAVRGREALSTPFRYEIDFSTDKLDYDNPARSDRQATLRDRDGTERSGARGTDELEIPEGAEGHLPRRRVVVPLPALLRPTRRSRIFQAPSVPEIVAAVFADHEIKGDKGYRLSLRKTYA